MDVHLCERGTGQHYNEIVFAVFTLDWLGEGTLSG